MKFFWIFFLLVSFNIYAELPKPKIDTKKFVEQMNVKNKDYLYTNENGNQKDGFKQIFFRDRSLDSKYNSLYLGITEYRISYRGESRFYAYGETFLDCKNQKKLRVEQVYDKDGYYLESQAYSFDFRIEELPINSLVCDVEPKQ